jgi:hypothetical protein
MLILLTGRSYKARLSMGSCVMKIGTGHQAVLKFHLSSSNGCNVGITDGGDLRTERFKGAEVI